VDKALQEKARMIADKDFRRRLFDGDMVAKEKWGRTIAALSLKPVR
jgi:hypothetical protein